MSFFSPEEFFCKCKRPECDAPKEIAVDLMTRLGVLRELVGRRLVVTSGLRCAYWNERQGGAPDSEHMTGEAADLAAASGAERYAILRHALPGLFARVGVGAHFVHVGVSRTLAQQVVWTYPGR